MQLNQDLESVLQKIHTGYYQEITIDQENSRVQISEPWNGKALYLLGYRTNVDELTYFLLDKVRESTVKLENNALSKKERLEVLTSIKLLRCIIKEKTIDPSLAVEDSLLEIKKITSIFKNSLAKEPVPVKPEEIMNEISQFRSKDKMSMYDQLEQKLHFAERTKEVLKAYKAIETTTKNMRPNLLIAETFTCPSKQGNITFEAYSLPHSEKFMVHTTSFMNAVPVAKVLENKALKKPVMCVSLVDTKTETFWGEVSLILAVDPRLIVLTTHRDIASPIFLKNETIDRSSPAYKFYHTQQSFLRLAEQIDQIHRASGKVTSNYFEIKQLEQEKRKCEKLINYYEFQWLGFEKKAEIQELKNAADFCDQKIKEKVLPLKNNSVDLEKMEYLWKHISDLPASLQNLILYYHENSEKNYSPDEFQKNFGYPGKNIFQELNKYTNIIKNLKNDLHEVNKYTSVTNNVKNEDHVVKKLESPDDLLAATGLSGPIYQHNEINLKLDTVHARTPTVEGILINRSKIIANTKESNFSKVEAFSQMIRYAEENNIPIFIKEDRQELRSKL